MADTRTDHVNIRQYNIRHYITHGAPEHDMAAILDVPIANLFDADAMYNRIWVRRLYLDIPDIHPERVPTVIAGIRIAGYCIRHNLSQAELAKLVGISAGSVSQAVNGKGSDRVYRKLLSYIGQNK